MWCNLLVGFFFRPFFLTSIPYSGRSAACHPHPFRDESLLQKKSNQWGLTPLHAASRRSHRRVQTRSAFSPLPGGGTPTDDPVSLLCRNLIRSLRGKETGHHAQIILFRKTRLIFSTRGGLLQKADVRDLYCKISVC